MGIREKCLICGDDNSELCFDLKSDYKYTICPICGKYILPNSTILVLLDESPQNHENKLKLSRYLFYNKFGGYQFIGTEEEYNSYRIELPKLGLKEFEIKLVTEDKVNSWYPKSFSERIDLILLYLNSKTKFIGEKCEFSYLELTDIFMIDNRGINLNDYVDHNIREQIDYINSYLCSAHYINISSFAYVGGLSWTHKISYQITPTGLARIDELQKKQINNKDVFVAMSFRDENEYIFSAIKDGITEAGYSDKFMKKIIHNQQIIPYMLRLIKECKFLIMDITDPNYGAYYEAGYALGLNKEVIITCKKDVFEKKLFDNPLEEKAYKPHFDIAQKQVLIWETPEDLTKQLKEWIKYIIG